MLPVILTSEVPETRIYEGAARYFRASGAPVCLFPSADFPWSEVSSGMEWGGALLLVRSLGLHPEVRSALRRIGYPVVLLSPVSGTAWPEVREDGHEAGRLAAEYFLRRRFQSFAIAGQNVDAGYHECIRGFECALAERGHACRRMIYHDYVHTEKPRGPKLRWGAYLQESVRSAEKPLAILALDDPIGASVLRHCASAGIRIPEEVVVLGVGNSHIHCDYALPPLSSIDMNQEKLGWKAAEILHGLMKGGRRPDKPLVVPPLGVVERRSTEILGAGNPLARRALLYLWDHLSGPTQPADVARAVGVSRQYLDRLFLASFGRTVKQEQVRVRMQRIREMLATSGLSLKEIAAATGFRTLAHMSRAFAEEHKLTLRQFRLQFGAGERMPWDASPVKARLIPREDGSGKGSSRRRSPKRAPGER